jgi:hypothetical protein
LSVDHVRAAPSMCHERVAALQRRFRHMMFPLDGEASGHNGR